MSAVRECTHPAGFRCVVCHPENFPLPPAKAAPSARLGFVHDDGGRAAAGFVGVHDAGDCVARAIAIAAGMGYREVYDGLAALNADHGGRRTARDGLRRKVYDRWLRDAGWTWTATMGIGTGCRVHLRSDELPPGRLIVAVSKHMVAVVDHVVHDTSDPTRGGTRCVYGYWTEPAHEDSRG